MASIKEGQRPVSQKLPAGLATVLNAPDENRDSAYFSSTDASSKHTSTASGFGINVTGPSGYYATSDKTPSPPATHLIPQSTAIPTGGMTINSMVSPATPGNGRRDRERPMSLESGPHALLGINGGRESRRESVDSRMNLGFDNMRLGSSPYASHNQSTTSIQNSLAQQRNPRGHMDSLSMHRMSHSYQPGADRIPDGQPKVARTAPVISGPATSHIARAAEPTKGQAWAFPEPEIQRLPSAAGSIYQESRRSSIADSIASSQFTVESRLPAGQRRLDDVYATDFTQDYTRQSRQSVVSADFPAVHHHSLQNKQLSELQSEESSPQAGVQPYSRTPELRVSHKLAERKRRTEMKELFEQLRDLMPQERATKASKWEILTKAIAEHQRQQDLIKQLHNHCTAASHETEQLRRDLDRLRVENAHLRGGGQPPAVMAAPQAPQAADQYDPFGRGPARQELPPLRNLNGGMTTGPEAMTGVQYEAQRPSGYRPDRY